MSSGNIVKLNIGGTIFQTSKSTLAKYDGFFKTMLETDIPLGKDENGAIFIDRPAKHFESILSYMRDGDVELPDCEKERKEIMKEAQYYLLTYLVALCQPKQSVQYLERKLKTVVDVIAKSTKKAVLIIPYRNDVDILAGATTIARIHDKHSKEFDVYFLTSSSSYPSEIQNWTCHLYDKTSGVRHSANINNLDTLITQLYGN